MGRTRPQARQAPSQRTGLGLDVGGTQTRWAVAHDDGRLLGQGVLPGFNATLLAQPDGRLSVVDVLAALQVEVQALLPSAALHRVWAGITGTDAQSGAALRHLMATQLGLPASRIDLASDIEMACRAAFEPGGGYVVYAGTGSIAGYVDAQHQFHRAGGRGHLVDDAGSGHWIATQALRQIWRAEDARPGAWRASPLARRVLGQIGVLAWPTRAARDADVADTGQAPPAPSPEDERAAAWGADWSVCRQWLAQASRGEVGQLALAVAADGLPPDAAAQNILIRAGQALADLVLAMSHRHGLRPVALAGRVFLLSPLIERALRASLPPGRVVNALAADLAVAAARRAATAP